jgi:RimJ/RimL family protein N-acetyltransferase
LQLRAMHTSRIRVLETEHLRLRPLKRTDAEHLLELDTDPEVRRYVHFGAPPTLADVEAALPRMLSRFGSPPVEPTFWAVEERSTGVFAGWFHLRPASEPGILELGFRLRRQVWGRGYATEGARALVHRAFQHLHTERVEAIALVTNAASIRVMKKIGLRFRKRFLFGGKLPVVRYALERKTYIRDAGAARRNTFTGRKTRMTDSKKKESGKAGAKGRKLRLSKLTIKDLTTKRGQRIKGGGAAELWSGK